MNGQAANELIDFSIVSAGGDEKSFLEVRPRKDSEATKSAILTAAMYEYSEYGVSGARIDRIASRAKANKSLIYSYFGDKEALYTLVLRAAYLEIRAAERELDLGERGPEEAIKELTRFTLDLFISSPWFFRLLAEENLRRGETVQKMGDVSELQSALGKPIERVLNDGIEQGIFKRKMEPHGLYLLMASLFFFPLSNRYTLKSVFEYETDTPEWRDMALKQAQDVMLAFLKSSEK